jgi:hypothetical protein
LVREAVLDHDGQGFGLFAFEESTILEGDAALLPGSKTIRLVGDYHDRFPWQDIKVWATVKQAGWIVDVAAIVTATFNQSRIRFKNHKFGSGHFFSETFKNN